MSSSSLGMGRPSHGQGSSPQPRQSSAAVYNMFDPKQVQTFKEAFSMIDQDSDGWITEADLKTMLTSLGQKTVTSPNTKAPKLLTILATVHISTRQTGVNGLQPRLKFHHILNDDVEKLLELDPESELIEAFECFDEDDKGTTDGKELREWLGTVGDKMSKEEIDKLLSPPLRIDMVHSTIATLFALRVSEADPVSLKE
ncbi:hypothetical protein PSTT_08194 [Puccinia striiformis]|uniref:EF-hand domain-containing protein n=1 Tax=Puccinia striiformis TaxID=27350 RepID=A0A2S4VDE5_9BASI|nr:hypothetical protein PSTT_08194 [Puccinia striiformis]